MRQGRGHVFDDPEKLEDMLLRLARGAKPVTLAREYGCDHTSILYHARKHEVVRGKTVELLVAETDDPIAHLEALEDAPKPPTKVYKYQALFEEPLNPGKTYAEYVAAENKKLAPMRKARLDKAKVEMRERHRLIKQGKIPNYLEKEDKHWNNPVIHTS